MKNDYTCLVLLLCSCSAPEATTLTPIKANLAEVATSAPAASLAPTSAPSLAPTSAPSLAPTSAPTTAPTSACLNCANQEAPLPPLYGDRGGQFISCALPGDESRPSLTQGKVKIKGALDEKIVRRVLKRVEVKLRYCYESSLLKHPGINGDMTLAFTVTTDGSVSGATVSKGINAELDACLTEAITKAAFPTPADGAAVKIAVPLHAALPALNRD